MSEQKNPRSIEMMDIQIGLTILVCLLLCHWANRIEIRLEALAVSTGAIMCVQDSTKAAYQTSLIRILGVFCGGGLGVVIALIDNAVDMPYVFYLLCSLGVVANLLLCKILNLPYVQARVSCLSLLLVVLVGTDRLTYALARFVGSLVGALVALMVTFVFALILKNRKVNSGD